MQEIVWDTFECVSFKLVGIGVITVCTCRLQQCHIQQTSITVKKKHVEEQESVFQSKQTTNLKEFGFIIIKDNLGRRDMRGISSLMAGMAKISEKKNIQTNN